jgi:CubicO group peptidase (beta-lactamase class C family)
MPAKLSPAKDALDERDETVLSTCVANEEDSPFEMMHADLILIPSIATVMSLLFFPVFAPLGTLAMAQGDMKAQDRVLKTGKPEAVGMSAGRLQRAAQILEQETQSGPVLAASILVARHGQLVLEQGFGRLRPGTSSSPATADTVYFLASITKPVTAAALLLLVEHGQLCLSDPVQKYLPEFQGPQREKVRVQDLLSHVSGLPDQLPENLELRRAQAPLVEFVKRAMTTPLLYTPRTFFAYQSMGILLAAEIVERLTKMPLREFEQKELFEPLGMENSALGLGSLSIENTAWCQGAPSYTQNDEDEKKFGANTQYWRDMGHPWGGMHSNVYDLGIFLQMFLNGGRYNGKRILSPSTVKTMTSDQNREISAPWGLGWALKRSSVYNYFGDLGSDHTFGHVGATGTVAWADPEKDLLCVILTTRALSEDNGFLLRRVSNVVLASVEE